MAVGDVKSGMTTGLTTNQYVDIRPPAGEEWILHNIYYNGSCGFFLTDGTNSLTFDNDTTYGSRYNMTIHVTNAKWLKIQSTGATAIAYDGVQTK